MKYYTKREDGGIELREGLEVPGGAIALSDDDYDAIIAGAKTIVDDAVVDAPAELVPQKLPPIASLEDVISVLPQPSKDALAQLLAARQKG